MSVPERNLKPWCLWSRGLSVRVVPAYVLPWEQSVIILLFMLLMIMKAKLCVSAKEIMVSRVSCKKIGWINDIINTLWQKVLVELKLNREVLLQFQNHFMMQPVAVSCGYDTWFAVRLVMDYTTSHFTWSILRYLWIPADQVSPGQTHKCPGACGSRQKGHVIILKLVPSISYLRVYMGCALAFVLQVRSLYVPCYMVHFRGSISGSP